MIIVLGKAKVMDCCLSITFPDNYEEIYAEITEVNQKLPLFAPGLSLSEIPERFYRFLGCVFAQSNVKQ